MRIVVTGSSGRLGLFVVRELLAQHFDVVPVDRRAHSEPAMPATQVVDLAQPGDYRELFRDVQVVCHLGNLPSFDPRLTPGITPAKGFAENVTSTYVVFDAAFDMGVRHFVYASSINAYGVCLMSPDKPELVSPPQYLPVDEDHPLLPCDAYPLSKRLGEEIAESFARRDAATTVYSLRFTKVMGDRPPGVAWPHRPRRVYCSLMAYIHVADAARAVRMCCQQPRPGHTPLNICAPRASAPWDREMILASYGTIPEMRGNLKADDPLMSPKRAQEILGFVAELDPSGHALAKSAI